MRKLVLFVCALSSAMLLNACAIGNKHSYHETIASVNASGTTAVAVAVHDQREYVVSGKKQPDFVGLQRGGYGNPFNVATASEKPLSEDMAQTLVNSLAKKGFRATAVSTLPGENPDAVISRLAATKSDRSLLLTLIEWKSDTYQNTALIYDIRLQVLGQDGKVIADKAIKGSDDLRGSFWDPPAHAKQAVPAAYKEKLEKLLNNPEIEKGLQ